MHYYNKTIEYNALSKGAAANNLAVMYINEREFIIACAYIKLAILYGLNDPVLKKNDLVAKEGLNNQYEEIELTSINKKLDELKCYADMKSLIFFAQQFK